MRFVSAVAVSSVKMSLSLLSCGKLCDRLKQLSVRLGFLHRKVPVFSLLVYHYNALEYPDALVSPDFQKDLIKHIFLNRLNVVWIC